MQSGGDAEKKQQSHNHKCAWKLKRRRWVINQGVPKDGAPGRIDFRQREGKLRQNRDVRKKSHINDLLVFCPDADRLHRFLFSKERDRMRRSLKLLRQGLRNPSEGFQGQYLCDSEGLFAG